jgi:hypothetical protein
VRRARGRRGVEIRQRVQLTYTYRYLFLVVDGQAGRVHRCWNGSMASDETVLAVGGLFRERLVDAPVWDGAGSHRDGRLAAFGRPPVALPPDSPELNPAERVFAELRQAVEGRAYATIEDKVAAVEAELAELDADPARVRSLANWGWIEAALPRPALTSAA